MFQSLSSRPRDPTFPQIKEHQGIVLAGETLVLSMFCCFSQNNPITG